MKIKIDIKKKYAFLIASAIIVLAIVLGVVAYGTSNPSVFGHSANEIEGVCRSDGTGCPAGIGGGGGEYIPGWPNTIRCDIPTGANRWGVLRINYKQEGLTDYIEYTSAGYQARFNPNTKLLEQIGTGSNPSSNCVVGANVADLAVPVGVGGAGSGLVYVGSVSGSSNAKCNLGETVMVLERRDTGGGSNNCRVNNQGTSSVSAQGGSGDCVWACFKQASGGAGGGGSYLITDWFTYFGLGENWITVSTNMGSVQIRDHNDQSLVIKGLPKGAGEIISVTIQNEKKIGSFSRNESELCGESGFSTTYTGFYDLSEEYVSNCRISDSSGEKSRIIIHYLD